MHTDYRHPLMRQLRDQQVRYAPRDKRVLQVVRAEKFLGEVQDHRAYTYEYIVYRITDFRPDSGESATIGGADLTHDLCLFIEDVSDAADLRVEDARR